MKETISKMKRQSSEWQKILAKEATDKELTSKIYKQLMQLREKAMAPHSSTVAWRIPWTEKPGRLQSMGSRRVDTTERLHFNFSLSCIGEGNGDPPLFSPGESQGRGSLVGCRLWGRTELDTTEVT